MCEFPPFQLDTVNQLLLRRASTCDHERVRLTPKAFSVLRCLVERAGRLVTPDELLDAAWPGVYVEPQTVKSHILQIRDALGDDRRSPVYIETLHKRGYRFIAHVRSVADPQQAPAPAAPTCLVGRAQALGELNDGLRRTLHGERQIAFITGETGIGKTALLDAFGSRWRAKPMVCASPWDNASRATAGKNRTTRCWKLWVSCATPPAVSRSLPRWRRKPPPGWCSSRL
jgi:DNA-binding winged helix-turn-helix (wHTH) protein